MILTKRKVICDGQGCKKTLINWSGEPIGKLRTDLKKRGGYSKKATGVTCDYCPSCAKKVKLRSELNKKRNRVIPVRAWKDPNSNYNSNS